MSIPPAEGVTQQRPDSRRSTVREIRVHAGQGRFDYSVLVGKGLLAQGPTILRERTNVHRWFVIADETVASLYAADLLRGLKEDGSEARLVSFPAGERNKNRETWASLTDALLVAGAGRDSGVIALGGGVTGDLAGFVAATLLRGIPVVQLPTSLVAMIDSSVGGKTGVDTAAGKNLVGAFHPPSLVIADPETVRTLPRNERAQGLVEALKHGAILDEAYLIRMERDSALLLDGEVEATEAAVLRSVELKASVVGKDERESDYRQVLNFGHTLGHAIEAASQYSLPHGSAVAIGMVLEASLGERLGVTQAGTSQRLRAAVERLDLPSAPPPGIQARDVVSFLGTDKKRKLGQLRCVFLRKAGQVHDDAGWSQSVALEDVRATLEDSLS